MILKHGGKAHRAHMSRVMKASWAKRRNVIAAREALKNFSELTSKTADKPSGTVTISADPQTRFVTLSYCPNCGEHLANYRYEYSNKA